MNDLKIFGMKKLTIFLVLVILSRIIAGQENMLTENHQEGKNRQEEIYRIEPERFLLPDSLKSNQEFRKNLPASRDYLYRRDGNRWINPHNQELFFGNSDTIYSRIPVYNPRIHSRMPVMKIDKSAHYYIKEKRIILINPNEK